MTDGIDRHDGKADLLGLRVSAGLLILLGCLWAFYAVFCIILLALISWHSQNGPDIHGTYWHQVWPPLLTAIIMGALCWLCFKAGTALYSDRRWGAHVAVIFGLLLLLVTGSLVYDWYHPEGQIPDEGFTILIVPLTFAAGLWWCAYLNLPGVKRRLRS